MNSFIRTGASGFAATLPMSLVMLLQPSLPPKQITKESFQKAHLEKPDSLVVKILSVAAHFCFGSIVAAPYAALKSSKPNNFFLRGSLYGLGVWATNYFAVLPLLKYHTNGYKMSQRDNLVTAASHVVWGITLAALTQYTSRNERLA